MSIRKWQSELLQMAREFDRGATIERTNGDHLAITLHGPLGSRKVITGSTPGRGNPKTRMHVRTTMRQVARDLGVAI